MHKHYEARLKVLSANALVEIIKKVFVDLYI